MIVQLDLSGRPLEEFNSLTEAAQATNIVDTNIKAVISGRRKTAGGFLWEENEFGPPTLPIRRLFFDVETSPNIGLFWSAGYKLNIDYSNIIKERAIICICYKWEGERKVHSLHWDRKQDDKAMLKAFIKVANEADELIGHNGDRYDLPWLRTRALFHRLPMFPKYTTTDTLKVARSKFRFNSNRLDYIGQFLGLGKKIQTEFSLWKDILLNKCPVAMNKMVEYCQGDVRLLEKIYRELRNHVEPKQHYGSLYLSNKEGCPECGSENLAPVITRATPAGTIKRQYRCRKCGKHHSKTLKRKVH